MAPSEHFKFINFLWSRAPSPIDVQRQGPYSHSTANVSKW